MDNVQIAPSYHGQTYLCWLLCFHPIQLLYLCQGISNHISMFLCIFYLYTKLYFFMFSLLFLNQAVLICYPFLWLQLYLYLFKQRRSKLRPHNEKEKKKKWRSVFFHPHKIDVTIWLFVCMYLCVFNYVPFRTSPSK